MKNYFVLNKAKGMNPFCNAISSHRSHGKNILQEPCVKRIHHLQISKMIRGIGFNHGTTVGFSRFVWPLRLPFFLLSRSTRSCFAFSLVSDEYIV